MKVLVAEDDSTSRNFLQKLLTKWGYEVLTARDGTEAWELLRNGEGPSLLLLDWMIPGMDGIEICQSLREKFTSALPYIILLTAKDTEDDLALAFQAGANDFLTKPYKRGELKGRLLAGERIVTLQMQLTERVNQLEKQRLENERMNRSLRILLQYSQILARTDNENALLQETCDLLVNSGGHRMAWVGYKGKDDNSQLISMASARQAEVKLDITRLSWGANSWGTDGSGALLLPDTPRVIGNILTDPRCKTWGEDASNLGLNSAIMLPLSLGNLFQGVLFVYSSEVEAFDAEESKLMVGLADDLTHGILSIRNRLERKRVEDVLRKLSQAVEQSPVSVVITDLNGNIEYVNLKFSRLTGYSFEEVLGKNPSILKSGETPAEEYARLWETITAGEEWRGEFHNRKKNGELYWETASISPIRDSEGAITHFLAVKEETTEKKRVEDELKSERHLFRTLMDTVPANIYFKDGTGRFLRVNHSMTNHFGLSDPGQILGRTDFDFFSQEHAQQAYRDERKIIESGQPLLDLEEKETWPDGRITWVSTSKMSLVDPEGIVIGTFGISRDITKRKLMEDALHKAHREMTDLVDSIPSIIIKLDHEGKIIQWNRTATETLGIPLAAAIGRRLEKCKIKWDLSKVIGVIAESSKDRHLHRLEDVRYERPDGTKGLLSITLSFLGREMDQEEGLILSATDISERRELENHLRQAQRIESIGQLAAGIAHEINTPTQYVGDNIRFLQESLGGLIDLLDVYGQLSEAVRTGSLTPELSNLVEASAREADIEYLKAEIPKAIQQSLEGVAQVSKIVRSMKEFAHPGQTEKVATDLNRAIESTLTVARNEWKYVAEVVTDLDPSLPLVPCHSGDFNQVILNLLTNGAHAIATKVKETGEKGTIGVQTRRVDGWAEIRVRDTGTGIPPEIQSKIFDPFFTTKEVGKGTGQGLAISHSVVVDKHGGSISFETEVGRGTEFIVRLPLGEAPRVS